MHNTQAWRHAEAFGFPPFVPWCQTNLLLTQPKNCSSNRHVILNHSWLHLPAASVKRGTPIDMYLRVPKKMRLPSVKDLADNIHRAGRGSWLYSCDVARAYWQLPLDPADWPLICLVEGGRFYIDVSLPFGMRWVAALSQDATSMISSHLNKQGAHFRN